MPQVFVWSAVFDTLTYVDEKGSASAGLAVSWRNVDQKAWQVKLRPNVKFKNGESFNAQSVVDANAWFKSDAGKGSVGAQTFTYVTDVKAVDEVTVEFTTSALRPIFPIQMAAFYVAPPKAWRERGIEDFSKLPVGTGSHQPKEWSGERIVMEAFAGFWRAPKIAKLDYVRLPEEAAHLQALVANQIDTMIQVQPDEVKTIEGTGGKVDYIPSPLLLQLGFALENAKAGLDIAPLKDKRVRHALNYAVDKDSINKKLMGGIMSANTQFLVPTVFGHNPDLKPWPHDQARAKQLLTEAGYANGLTLNAKIRAFGDVWQQVAQDLSKVGVKLELRQVPFADWLQKFLGVKWEGHAFDLTLGVAPEIDTIRMMFFQSCRKNPAYYCNQSLMPLIDQIDAGFDVEKRRKMLQQLMVEMREDAPALFLFEQRDLNAYGKRVRGFKNVNRIFSYHEMTRVN
ncbi:MAG: ABC transporter substrate-binding protein [Alphaproteobacteria bacterium]|nr:ABC transporter substrate-binding protein [Alphaproteobacteria bacterium]